MRLSESGQRVQQAWEGLVARFPRLTLDAFVVMPNHVHGVLVLDDEPAALNDIESDGHSVGAQFIAPAPSNGATTELGRKIHNTPNRVGDRAAGAMNCAPTVGEIVRTMKAVSTRSIRLAGVTAFAWQRNYYEHIVRNEASLREIRGYIDNNPQQWDLDRFHPDNLPVVRAGSSNPG